MIGIVLVTHGKLGAEFLLATEHVCGAQSNMHAVAIGPDDDVDARREEILKIVQQSDTGKGVIVLTDLFGGTPCNLALSIMDKARVEVLAGINLPMLIKLAGVRDKMELKEAVREAEASGKKYITVASQLLDLKND